MIWWLLVVFGVLVGVGALGALVSRLCVAALEHDAEEEGDAHS